ncbi:MAG: hypothetical protein DRO15_06270 [Thermoprotei archaeon]|nr:MAG: hypothetical protein DRO15_06270 [Thermoprotei archaeon]
MSKAMRFHGGVQDRNVLDFSVNLNPLGVPKCIRELITKCISKCVYERYPDYEYRNLRNAIAKFFNIPRDNIVPTNGASEALSLCILALRPRTIIILDPSYGDYDLICRAIGANCIHMIMQESNGEYVLSNSFIAQIARYSDQRSLIIINSPNNPTGSVLEWDKIIELSYVANHSYVVLDEVYAELSDYTSILNTSLGSLPENLIVIKSFTKVFAIPGIRVGFIYTNSTYLYELFESTRPTWNIGSIADCLLTTALVRFRTELWNFIEKSRAYIARERNYLVEKLHGLGLTIYSSKTNFLLLKHKPIDCIELHKYLLRRFRIAIRPAHTFYGLTRFHSRVSIRSRNENEYLVEALKHAIKDLKNY